MSGEKKMLRLYAAATTGGVCLFYVDPDTEERKGIFTVEPQFARDIAANLTMRSFECEDMRNGKYRGEGSNGTP